MATAKEVKKILENAGYDTRYIRCRVTVSSIDVTVLTWHYNLENIEQLLNHFSKVTRCEATGEILSGGNTFVFVDYSSNLEISDDIKAKVAAVKAMYSSDVPELSLRYFAPKRFAETYRDFPLSAAEYFFSRYAF